MRIKVKLKPQEIEYIKGLSEQRNAKEKRFGAKTYNNKLTGQGAHLIGLAAEFAVSQLFNLKLDDAIYHNRGDSGVDLKISFDNKTMGIAVKATTYRDEPFLRAEVKHNNDKIDIYILCYVNKDDVSEVELVGWQYRTIVEKAKIRKFSQFGPQNYVLKETELRSIHEFK